MVPPQSISPRPAPRETARRTTIESSCYSSSEHHPKAEKPPGFFARNMRRISVAIFNEPKAPEISGKNFATYITEQRKANAQPPELQGLWVAYGHMRAVKTAGRFAVLATGLAGIAFHFPCHGSPFNLLIISCITIK